MATHSLPAPFDLHYAPAASGARRKRRLLRRFVGAFIESRQRQADREIARYLESSGGKLTDSAEREIERRFVWPSVS